MQQKDDKKILWHTLAFMAFSTVWGFGNVINGFSEYGGLKAIVSWILIFAIYFVPYALMVGELGSTFKHAGGGVSSWIHETIGPKMAYYAGWTYWVDVYKRQGKIIVAYNFAGEPVTAEQLHAVGSICLLYTSRCV